MAPDPNNETLDQLAAESLSNTIGITITVSVLIVNFILNIIVCVFFYVFLKGVNNKILYIVFLLLFIGVSIWMGVEFVTSISDGGSYGVYLVSLIPSLIATAFIFMAYKKSDMVEPRRTFNVQPRRVNKYVSY